MKLNKTRVWLGGIAGGVVWTAWGFLVGMRLAPLYEAMQKQGLFLKEPRYPFFTHIWIVLIFVMSILIAHLYAWARATAGPGPKTALKIGMLVGFCAGVPGNFAQATWSPIPRMLPLGWMLDLWIGSILAALVAGFVYKSHDGAPGVPARPSPNWTGLTPVGPLNPYFALPQPPPSHTPELP